MRICLILYIINFMIIVISSIQYDQRCTFSLDTCNWSIGRRWQAKNVDDEIDDKVLIAVDGNSQDKEMGFTDVITSPWLYLTSSCSFDIRLTFQFSIENEDDQIELFLIKNDGTQVSSEGRWKALTNDKSNMPEDIESLWQQANITFKAAEEFRIEIEIRHLPDNKIGSTTWFAIDDILIESCPHVRTSTTTTTQQTITTPPRWTARSNLNISSSSLFNRSFFRSHWKFNDSFDSPILISPEELSSPHLALVSFVLYILFTLIALSLLIIFLAIIISTYRKHCLPSSTLSAPIIAHRSHSHRKKKHHRTGTHNSHIDQDARTERTMVSTIRPYC